MISALLSPLFAWAALSAPPNAPFGAGAEVDLRAFHDVGAFSGMMEGAQRWDTDQRNVKTFTLGGYAHAGENLSVGAFYRRAYGLRHDDDWIYTGGTTWAWADSRGRGESLLIGDVTPRLELGESWVGELKARYGHDIYDQENTLTLRPGVTYFWQRDDEPFLSCFARYELSFPLNFDTETLNEEWGYLGAAYYLRPNLQLAGTVTYHAERWGTAPAYWAKFAQNYVAVDRSLLFGASAILVF